MTVPMVDLGLEARMSDKIFNMNGSSPYEVYVNIRSPILLLILCTFSRKRDIKESYTLLCIMIRVPETQVWPEATKAANAVPLTALIRSASSKMTIGACELKVSRC